jgi:hypothetical protein
MNSIEEKQEITQENGRILTVIRKNGSLMLIAATVILAAFVGAFSERSNREDFHISLELINSTTDSQPLFRLDENELHGQLAVRYIEYISNNYYERFSFSYQERDTAAWLARELSAMANSANPNRGERVATVEVQEFLRQDVQGFMTMPIAQIMYFIHNSPFANLGMRSTQLSQNVTLTVPGESDEMIIVGAHYDALFFPGASDNASGMALVLESAQRMLAADNYYTIVYAFWGAEEVGLFGSYVHADSLTEQQHENIKFVINADVLLEGADLFYMAGYDRAGKSWREIERALSGLDSGFVIEAGSNRITETWDELAHELNESHDINLMALPVGIFGSSDQLAFLPQGHTVMFLAGVDGGGSPEKFSYFTTYAEIAMMFMSENRVYHSVRDDFRYINENSPGLMEANMKAFGLFLEEILLADYT